ncbi:hypothetical protein ACODT5_10305 [Streptomyces sp. 5.8]|uniref:hypothetical protein n=1 Tax=Streptomyces sp. 5.8 TaxID=3406571 RepID=UPI003BB70EC0
MTGRADRWLLFLQPVPPFPPEPEKGDRKRATRLVRIAAKSLAVKSGSESLYEDAVEMRAAAAATQLARAVTRALPADRAALQGAALARAASYRRPGVGHRDPALAPPEAGIRRDTAPVSEGSDSVNR